MSFGKNWGRLIFELRNTYYYSTTTDYSHLITTTNKQQHIWDVDAVRS